MQEPKIKIKLKVGAANWYSFTVKEKRKGAYSYSTYPNKKLKVKEGDIVYLEIGVVERKKEDEK